MAVERWRQECGPHIGEWITVVGEFEGLVSLAAFAYERPETVFPDLLEDASPRYEVNALAHPLIAAKEAIANDVSLGEEQLWIVSGSNMSGKSTLLRAVGLSVAMAWAGAPVTAGALRLTRLRVGASLRANDSLADHQSRFYAEIRRLKHVVDLAGSGQTMFLLDELLSGTNSHDRRIGAEALLRGLLERGAIGLATTHDLALTEIAQSMGGNARNVHFEDQFESGAMKWDYRLRQGTIEKGNALELMRAVGLDV
jgi:DNA mismatch repair ATPase MutS